MSSNDLICCSSCNELKPLSEFSRNSRSKSRHLSICKTCQKSRISIGKRVSASYPPSAFKAYNPKFEGQQPLQLIAAMRELAEELKNRGFSYKGELTYLNVIKI